LTVKAEPAGRAVRAGWPLAGRAALAKQAACCLMTDQNQKGGGVARWKSETHAVERGL